MSLLLISFTITIFLPRKQVNQPQTQETSQLKQQRLKSKVSLEKGDFSMMRFKKGDTPIAILKRYGFEASDISKTIQSNLLKNFTLIPGEKFLVGLENKIKKLIFYHPQKSETVVLQKSPEKFIIEKQPVKFDVEVKKVSGEINGSIVESIKKKIPSDQVAYRFLDAFILDFHLRKDIQRGAEYQLEVEELYHHGKFVRFGEILSANMEVKSQKETRSFIEFPDGGAFIEDLEYHKNRLLYSPVSYIHVTSTFRPRRRHPITKRRIPHLGIDLELPTGSDIFAPDNGVVIKKGRARGPGKYIVLKHKNGLKTYYNHLSFIEDLAVGEQVKVGAKLGEIGCTGLCTKPHLHFAIKKNGKYVDPKLYLKSYSYAGYLWMQQQKSQMESQSQIQ